jgi:hypothetical protein
MLHQSGCARSLCGRAAQVVELLQGPHGTKVEIAYETDSSTKDKVPPPSLHPFHRTNVVPPFRLSLFLI